MQKDAGIEGVVGQQNAGNISMAGDIKNVLYSFGLLTTAGITEAFFFLMPPLTSIYFGEISADLGSIAMHAAALLAAIAAGYNLSIATENGLDERVDGIYQAVLKQFKPPKKQAALNYTV